MAGTFILKFAFAGVLALGLAAVRPAAAAPDDCADCTPAPSRYDTEEVIKKIQSANTSRESQASSPRPAEPKAAELQDDEPKSVGRKSFGSKSAEPKRPRAARVEECVDCPPPRKYDDQKVIKKVRNVDHSRVINTVTVVPAGRRVRETNRLVIRDNETRHVGVIQHNHTIVEKETRYVRRIPVETTVVFVTRKFHVVERSDTVTVPAAPPVRSCRGRSYGRYGWCGPLRVRG